MSTRDGSKVGKRLTSADVAGQEARLGKDLRRNNPLSYLTKTGEQVYGNESWTSKNRKYRKKRTPISSGNVKFGKSTSVSELQAEAVEKKPIKREY